MTITKIESRNIFGKTATVFGSAENPLFDPAEVCEWIEYHRNAKGQYDTTDLIAMLPDNDKWRVTLTVPQNWREIAETPKNITEPPKAVLATTRKCFITEFGIYRVLMRSNLPVAEQWQEAVMQLLHDIRTGKAQVAAAPTGDELILAAVAELQSRIRLANETIQKQADKIEADKESTAFGDCFRYKNAIAKVHQIAYALQNNGIDIGRNRLIKHLRDKGIINRTDAMLSQDALNRNLGENVPTGNYEYHGNTMVSYTAFLNYKGINLVFSDFGVPFSDRERVLKDLTADDVPTAETGGTLIVADELGNDVVID